MTTERVARVTTIAAVLALAALGLARPGSVLVGGAAWLAFLFFACSGWGWLVTRVARLDDPDFGLRAVWGAAAYLAVAGVLVMVGVCARPLVLALLCVGAVGFAWREWVTAAPLWQVVRDGARYARAHPLVAWAAVAITALVVAHLIGAVVRLDRSPWDDDVAYTPLVKRLLDAGNLVEPFSFRRLGGYGGQLALDALAGARGTLANVQLIDQGLCFGLAMLLVVGYARALRTSALWLALVALVAVAMPDIAVNTASYWSGVALFFALYRTVVRGELMMAAFVAAAICTLRQSYIPIAVLFLAIALWRARAERRTWLRLAVIGAAVLVPWCIASYVSSRTFLFPFVKGTFNHELSFGPRGWTWTDELSLLFTACIDAQPIVIALVVAPLIAFATDDRPGRPLHALLAASVLGFVLAVHSFSDADTGTLWRYAFAYAMPLLVAFALEVGSEPERLPPLGRWVLLAALLVQLVASRGTTVKELGFVSRDLREAIAIGGHGDPNARAEARRYADMQAAVPAGERLVVMLDDPAFLDFHRNPIANLDTPGLASPEPQLPTFRGPDALRDYLLGQGYRYIAFVRPDRSRYVFRREFWVWRAFNGTQFFQAVSAYTIDMIDSLTALAITDRVVYEDDGLVVVELDASHGRWIAPDSRDELSRRDAFLHDLAIHEHREREWNLVDRRDLVFADGMSGMTYAQPADDARWFDWFIRDPKPVRGQPIRWMQRRFHLRVRGESRMHLVLRGRLNLSFVYTRPRLDVSLDGELLASVDVGADGAFTIDLDVTPPRDWGDLYVVFDSIGQAERDVRDLRVARLEEVVWEPR
ncbi:MAG: hypothetical protein ACM31C_20465 [Acidobacteriota bacterium]